MAQDERRGIEFIDERPFMLRYSKHSEPFFSNLLVRNKLSASCE